MSDLDSQKTSDQLREEHLLERARGGDAGAARELFALCRPKVRRIVAARAPAAEVDDLVQETMIAGWAGIGRFGGKSSLLTWLAGIARNLYSNRARSAARTGTPVPLDSVDRDPMVQREARSAPLENRVAAQAATNLLYLAVERACSLPQQRVLLLAFQGEALDEIGALLQMSSATVRSHNRRGRCRLLSYLIQNHADLLGGPAAVQAAWETACKASDEAKRPDSMEAAAWVARNTGARAYCGAVLKLARYLHLAAALAWVWHGAAK